MKIRVRRDQHPSGEYLVEFRFLFWWMPMDLYPHGAPSPQARFREKESAIKFIDHVKRYGAETWMIPLEQEKETPIVYEAII